MSSYLKEKLDLRLEFSPRRTQSASAVDRPNNQTVHSPKGHKELPERPVKSADTKKVSFIILSFERHIFFNYTQHQKKCENLILLN